MVVRPGNKWPPNLYTQEHNIRSQTAATTCVVQPTFLQDEPSTISLCSGKKCNR